MGDRIVARIGARERESRHVHRSRGSRGFARKQATCPGGHKVHRVARDFAGQRCSAGVEGRGPGGVVGLVAGGDAGDGQLCGGDRRREHRLVQRIVGGVVSRQCETGHREGLCIAHGASRERRRCRLHQGDGVSVDHTGQAGTALVDGSGRGPVVDLVHAGGAAHRDRLRRDVGRGCRLRDRVVACLGSRLLHSGDADCLSVAGVPVGELAGDRGLHDRHVVRTDDPAECGGNSVECRGDRSVVGLVGGGDAGDGQGLRGDVGGRRRLKEGVVAGIIATDRESGNGDRLSDARIPVGERCECAGRGQRDIVAGDFPVQCGSAEGEQSCG